jgi:diguanylate cyclase (GGDEF)-like protein/PAS domain S-box-containing protein
VSGRVPGLDAARPILDVLAQPVIATDLEYRIIYWNPAATALYGYSAAEAIGKPVNSLLGVRDDLPELRDAITGLGQGQPWTGELQIRTRTGVALTTLLALTPLSASSGDLVAFIGTSVDVTAAVQDRRRLSDALTLVEQKTGELRFQALHDFLTGLPNRALILDRAEQMLARGRRHRIQVAALFVDLDHFKNINDSLGHAAGDELLRAVAVRLAGAVRDSDTVGRLGGDEFVVLAEGDSLDAGSGLVAQRLLDVLREPFTLHTVEGRPTPYPISASIGIADGDRAQAEDLLRDADLALYKSKAAGRNCYTVFETEMQTAVQDRLVLEADLRAALDVGQFYLDYQPTFNLYDTSTVGVEALLRWAHPTRGTVAPLQFIATLEDTGLIVPVGRWVLAEACRQGAAWHRDGLPLTVSVNVSARQLEAGSFPRDVTTALADSGLPPGALVIEITESILMRDAEATTARLTGLKATGIRIAIDDFGTGYSSLAYLRQFPVDVLKIDKSFVTGITNSDQGEALLHTLVQLGKRLGLQTVAEGIETRDQLRTLQLQDCDTGQGFLIAKPMTPAAITEYVRANQARTGPRVLR